MNGQTVHLTFGPVQEFIEQARRTRDVWAGSYLLSYLAAHALDAAARAGGTVVLPALDGNPLAAAVRTGQRPASHGNRVGSVPHVAELVVPDGQARPVAEATVTGWHQAWQQVSGAVRQDVRPRAAGWGAATDAIWDRQVERAWTHMWAAGDAGVMARRKSLRAFFLQDEPGEKCTCCGAREALHGGDPSRRGVRAFWAGLAEQLAQRSQHDVLPDGEERLCAVCTVKRLYPRVAANALGWDVPTGFPSTTTLASLPWRLKVLECGATDPRVREAVTYHCWELGEAKVQPSLPTLFFPGLWAAADRWPDDDRDIARQFAGFDGDWFSMETVGDRERKAILGERQPHVLRTLRDLRRAARDASLPLPGTSYALLAMDGDRMGQLLQDNADRKQQVSLALLAFSGRVREIVEGPDANGILIYAGGDDVLALLPKDTALKTAAKLRKAYGDSFKAHLPGASATISAGLVYAHMQAPLRNVVRTAHRLLEAEAKEKAGRDALAVAVWKRAGIGLTFAHKWGDDEGHGIAENIAAVRKALVERTFSRRFLYHLRELLPAIGPAWDEERVRPLLVATYLKSRERHANRTEVDEHVAVLQRAIARGQDGAYDAAPALLGAFLAEQDEE